MSDTEKEKLEALYAFNRQNYGEKIRKARTAKGYQQQELSSLLEMSKNTVSNWESGRTRPDINLIPKLCSLLDLSIPEFFGARPEKTHPFLKKYLSLEEGGREVAESVVDTLLRLQKNREVQIIDLCEVWQSDEAVSAGTGEAIGSGTGRMMILHANALTNRADEVLTVNGDSMEPTFHDGDKVLVQHSPCVEPGEIGVFIDSGEGLIKEYRRDGLHSHNPHYKTRRFSEFSDVRCIGRVIGRLDPSWIATDEEVRAWKKRRAQ